MRAPAAAALRASRPAPPCRPGCRPVSRTGCTRRDAGRSCARRRAAGRRHRHGPGPSASARAGGHRAGPDRTVGGCLCRRGHRRPRTSAPRRRCRQWRAARQNSPAPSPRHTPPARQWESRRPPAPGRAPLNAPPADRGTWRSHRPARAGRSASQCGRHRAAPPPSSACRGGCSSRSAQSRAAAGLAIRVSLSASRGPQKKKAVSPRLYNAIQRHQDMCWPPLIAIFAPVTNAASSDDRYATRPATSSGLPRRPIGICGMILVSSTSLGMSITILVPM
jgi:hypothetical protein